MADEIKVGDAVRLKSGSPRFCVAKVFNDKVTLVWHPYDSKYIESSENIPISVLVKVSDYAR